MLLFWRHVLLHYNYLYSQNDLNSKSTKVKQSSLILPADGTLAHTHTHTVHVAHN